jgi:hypothetical protein
MTTDENSIVDYLESKGIPGDMVARKRIAERHGIVDYTGTAEQNVKLLALLRNPPSTLWDEIKELFE